MADSVEEIEQKIKNFVLNEKISLSKIKEKISEEYQMVLMSSDHSFIEENFEKFGYQLWNDECKKLIEEKVNASSNNPTMFENLVREFNEADNFDNVPGFMKTPGYLLIQENRLFFDEYELSNLFSKLKLYLKSLVKEIQRSVADEYSFLENLIKVLQNSFTLFRLIIAKLKLHDFVNKRISLKDLANLVLQNSSSIENYSDLVKFSRVLTIKTTFKLENIIRSEIQPFLKTTTKNMFYDNGNEICKLEGPIISLKDVLDTKSKNIVVVCDTFHFFNVDSKNDFNLSSNNWLILANVIKVHHNMTLDFSGKDGIKNYKDDNAGKFFGKGINGTDGTAGENGGDLFIRCEEFKNSERLTIKSNGGNGVNGQNGGNGSDGADGLDVSKSDFDTGIPFGDPNSRGPNDYYKSHYTDTMPNGIRKYFYKYSPFAIYRMILLKGTDAKPGQPGGLSGFGGEGGFEGDIKIEVSSSVGNKVTIRKTRGRQGTNGIAGYNGSEGEHGRDAWGFDSSVQNRDLYGLDRYDKYKLSFSNNKSKYSIKDKSSKKWVSVDFESSIKVRKSYKSRNDSRVMRSRASHAIAKKKNNPLRSSKYQNLNSQWLGKNPSRFQTDILKFSKIFVNTQVALKVTEKISVKTTYKTSHDIEDIEKLEIDFKVTSITFQELLNSLLKEDLSFETFFRNLKKSDLTVDQYLEIKEMIKSKKLFFQITSNNNDNLAFHVRHILNNNSDFQTYSTNDAIFLMNEKIALADFHNHYFEFLISKRQDLNRFKKEQFTSENPLLTSNFKVLAAIENEMYKLPQETENKIPYLKDSGSFKSNLRVHDSIKFDIDFSYLNHFFVSDETSKREEIEFLYLKIKESSLEEFYSTGFVSSITGLFNDDEKVKKGEKYVKLFISILETLFKYKSELETIEENLAIFENEYLNSIKPLKNSHSLNDKKIVQDFLKRFLLNEKNPNFIEENLIEDGVFSPIYRKLICYAFRVNINIFTEHFDGSIILCEENKFDELIEFESTLEVPKVFNLMIKEDKITELTFNMNQFIIDQDRRFLAKQSIKEFENWRVKGNIYNFMNILKSEADFENILNDVLIRYFPLISSKENSDIKLTLDYIQDLKGTKILMALNTRLFHEECNISSNEFKFLIQKILQMISENPFMIDYFAVKLLSIKHTRWITEIIILQIENHLKLTELKLSVEWENHLNGIPRRNILLLFANKIDQLKDGEMSLDDFCKIIDNMRHFTSSNVSSLLKYEHLISWKNEYTFEYWLKKFPFLTINESFIVNELIQKFGKVIIEKLMMGVFGKLKKSTDLNVKEFLKKFNTGEWILNDSLFQILQNKEVKDWMSLINQSYIVSGNQRSLEQIKNLIHENADTSKPIKDKMSLIEMETNRVWNIKSKKYSNFTASDIKNWIPKRSNSVIDHLAVFNRAFKVVTGYNLRLTQLVSILILWNSEKGALIQVNTGEGKTFLGIGFSVLKFLNNEKVHIVTSSSVLAERDAVDETNLKIFKMFGIKAGHNCHQDSSERRRAYMECDILYGVLSNFQRDYLLTEFYDDNFILKENFQNVLVDEVDSILLDKGNNILYLSQDIPGLDELESLFTFIWQWVNVTNDKKEDVEALLKFESIRNAVFENWKGIIYEDDLKNLAKDYTNIEPMEIYKKLIDGKIIDIEGVLIQENLQSFIELNVKSVLSTLNLPTSLIENIIFLIKNKFNSIKMIKFPNYLHKFALIHLNKWIESALSALVMEDGQQYVIDRINDGSSVSSDPNIVIIDVDTGTDQKNSEWDEALCQFLQLKHGCKLSLYSLKSVFISNVSYFKLYRNLYGMTGTLGTIHEREKLNFFYNLDYVTIPTFLPKKFNEYDAILSNSQENWMQDIINEVKSMFEQERSVLMICNTINDIQIIEKAFKNINFDSNRVHTYQRDYEVFDLGDLPPKNLIIATNLAGRGTDIKLTRELKQNGGLHVILTYLASNLRIEQQAFGRSARSGSKGSARLIIMSPKNLTIQDLKSERHSNELNRLETVTEYYKNFIETEESLFKRFTEEYKKISENIKNLDLRAIILENLKNLWSFWLDEHSKDLMNHNQEIFQYFDTFMSESKRTDFKNQKTDLKSLKMHPLYRLKLVKYYEKELDKAIGVLEYKPQLFMDIDSVEYHKAYYKMKKNSSQTQYKKRDLKNNEVRILKQIIKDFQKNETDRNARGTFIKSTKEKHRRTLVPIQGFEKQEKNLNEMNQIFIDSLYKILGTGITPESFNCRPFGNPLLNVGFNKFLIAGDYIKKPSFNSSFDNSDVLELVKQYNVSSQELFTFLDSKSGNTIDSMEDIAKELQSAVEFPSREDFWNYLISQKVLVEEVEYAIIDLKTLNEFHPYTANEVLIKYKNIKIKELKTIKNSEIFLYNVIEDNDFLKEDQSKLAIINSKRISSDGLFQKFVNNNLVKFNKKANFDIKKYEEIKSKLHFSKFDSIEIEDFEVIKNSNAREQIIVNLIKQNILKKTEISSSIFYLNSNELPNLDLEQNTVYESDILGLINSKFSYRITLESLAKNLIENVNNNINSQDFQIKLFSNPHSVMILELIAKFIIQPSKVNQKKVKDNFEKEEMFKKNISKPSLISYLKNDFFDSGFSLPTNVNFDGLAIELLSRGDNIYNESLSLSNKFKNIEKTVKFMLKVKISLVEKLKTIKGILEDGVDLFQSNKYDNPEPILLSLKTLNPNIDHDLFTYMELKGLGYVIQIQEKKYSFTYFLNIFAVMLIGIVQIAVGLLITALSSGFLINLGQSFVSEGIGDIIFAISTLKNGTFSWKDYGKHKMMSIAVTAVTFGMSFGLSKIKCLSKFMKPVQTFGDKAVGLGYSGKSGIYVLRHAGRDAFKAMGKQIGKDLLKNTFKAVTMAGVSIGADKMIENFLDSIMHAASSTLTDSIQKNFYTHKLADTIDKLLEKKSENDVRELINNAYESLSEEKENLTEVLTTVGDTIDQIISANQKVSKLITVPATFFSKGAALSSMMVFISTVFDKLDEKLKMKLDPSARKIEAKSAQSILKFQQDIVQYINKDLTEKMKMQLNQNVTGPALKIIGNKFVDFTTSSITKIMKDRNARKKNKSYERQVAKLELDKNRLDNADEKSLNHAQENAKLGKLASKIKSHTTNPETLAKLAKLDFPMGDIEFEATARYLGLKIEIMHKGVKHTFGKSDKTLVKINLEDGHFPNSSDGNKVITNDCFYRSLKDQIDIDVNPDQFRIGVAKIIVNDQEIRSLVEDPRRKFRYKIGFYGGVAKNKSPKIKKEDFDLPHIVNLKSDKELKIPNNIGISELYNRRRAHSFKHALELVNDQLKKKDKTFKLTLDDLEGTQFSKIKSVDNEKDLFFPNTIVIKENVLLNIQKTLPSLTQIEFNCDDYKQQKGEGPKAPHIGITIEFDINGNKLKSLSHVVFPEIEKRIDVHTFGHEEFMPPTRTREDPRDSWTYNKINTDFPGDTTTMLTPSSVLNPDIDKSMKLVYTRESKRRT